MAEPETKTCGKYAYLDQLSTQQLEQLLRTYMDAPEWDEEAIFHITEVIQAREREQAPAGGIPDADQAWAEFQEYYHIPEGEGLSLYPMGDGEDGGEKEPPCPAAPAAHGPETRPPRGRRRRWVRYVVLAAMFVTLLAVTIAYASGFDLFGAIGRWTAEIFRFDFAGQTEGSPRSAEYQEEIRAALAECGMPEELAPGWYPDGFEIVDRDVTAEATAHKSIFYQLANAEGQFFSIQIQGFLLNSRIESGAFEKDNTNAEKYTSNGRTFYILTNNGVATALWTDDSFSMSIAGNISTEDIKAIIDSIGK